MNEKGLLMKHHYIVIGIETGCFKSIEMVSTEIYSIWLAHFIYNSYMETSDPDCVVYENYINLNPLLPNHSEWDI